MRPFKNFLLIISLFFYLPAITQNSIVSPVISESYLMNESIIVHMGVYEKSNSSFVKPKGDILYLHGYGDQFLNHLALFQKWAEDGFRVISFDYPSHGKTTGKIWKDLSLISMLDIVKIAGQVEREASKGEKIPLFLAGWSVGGLVAARVVQTDWKQYFSRPVSGLILFTPAVSIYPCVGNKVCKITNQTLTHNQILFKREISPEIPYLRPYFLGHILWNIKDVWTDVLDIKVPTLVILGGEKEDVYIKTKAVKKWVVSQKKRGAIIQTISCRGARHELDNESKTKGGAEVRLLAAQFFNKVLDGGVDNFSADLPLSICK